MVQDKLITVEVAYALPDKQAIIPVKVKNGATVYKAAQQSGVAQKFAQIDLDNDKMGIFGKAIRDPKTEILKAGDRVEIYRPLLIDPKASRLQRAEKAKRDKESSADKKPSTGKEPLAGKAPSASKEPPANQ